MGATHADHHTCYGMKTHNDQQGNEVKLMVVRSHDMQIFWRGNKSQLSTKGKETLKPHDMSSTGILSYLP
jgi:hypothetical protein